MNQLDQDLTYIRSAAPDLEQYLLSGVLFWPLNVKGKGRAPAGATQLTIGNLLLSMKRLETAAAAGLVKGEELTKLFTDIERFRQRWKSNWDKKAAQEIVSRLKQWDHYLSELDSEKGRRGEYPYNIRQRVILGLLLADQDRPNPRDQAYLEALDRRLKNATHASSFVWESTLQNGFPSDGYWYLYREPA
jgi:hypothetical protein